MGQYRKAASHNYRLGVQPLWGAKTPPRSPNMFKPAPQARFKLNLTVDLSITSTESMTDNEALGVAMVLGSRMRSMLNLTASASTTVLS